MPLDPEVLAAIVADAFATATREIEARVKTLEERPVVAPDVKTVTVQGEMGLPGQKGEPGKDGIGEVGPQGRDGAGISGLVISAEGRLIAHLTDGRTLDAGPVPVKDGLPGRDADPSEMATLKAEVASLRLELAARPPAPEIAALVAAAAPGPDAILEDVKQFIAAQVAAIPTPRDGKDADAGEIAAVVKAELALAVKAIPAPKDGAPGQDGASVSVDDVAPLIAAAVAKAVAAIPAPKDGAPGVDGQAVTIDDVAPLIAAEVQRAVSLIPPAEDGAPGQSIDVAEVDGLVEARVASALAAMPAPRDGERGADGTSLSVDDVVPLITAEIARAVAVIPVPKDGAPGRPGQDVTVDDVAPLIAAEVQKAVAGIPPAKDGAPGQGVTVDDVMPLIALEVTDEVRKAVAALPVAKDGEPGRSIDPSDVEAMVSTSVHKAVAALPMPKDGVHGDDGRSLTPDDVAPLIVAEVTKAVSAIPIPKDGHDGVALCGALIDREGRLALTLSDGTVKHLGTIVGRDGRDVDMADVASLISKELAAWPRPKDGADGLGFDDLSVLHDGERGFTVQFSHGDQVKAFSFTIPCVIYRDLWSDGRTYEKGDAVTFGGCMWVAKDATTAKPDFTPAAAKFWRLAVKEGRKGRDVDPAALEAMVARAVAKLPKAKDDKGPPRS